MGVEGGADYREEGLRRLEGEVGDVRTRGRAGMAKQIGEARDKGELSGNAG